ncbi:MFS transporter [Rhodococcus sp. WMMA185]|uniref:peptide MFS transporter n=1 Tax=Rhodococcus sp. WMMA185 TaxID=679318 RepID=UPI000877F557|nr:oligopeptide:H+ symporter [Rhodococcus sp. WMMA185]AOW93498.1 MFS transporter [Rhodococcus sp. WMMA185]
MGNSSVSEQDQASGSTFLGQPAALANLFGVEMWERFSFYGMTAILIYYLYYPVTDGGLGISQAAATSIVGAYGGTVYFSTIIGAWVADRLLGSERTLFYSAVLVIIGHVALATLPGLPGVGVGLVLVALGSGAVKANATSMVGELYGAGDNRRDAGYSIYYMGLNLGVLVGPLLTGLVNDIAGFRIGFALAALGMSVGLTQYVLYRGRLSGVSAEAANPLPRSDRLRYSAIALGVVVVVVAASVTHLLTADNLSGVVIVVTVLAAFGYFTIFLSSRKVTAVERSRIVAFIPLFIVSAVFWSLFQQQFTVLAIYADQRLDRNVFGWEFPAAWVRSITPVFLIIFAGLFAAMWTRLGPRQPTAPIKFAAGTAFTGLAFWAFLMFAGSGPNGAPLLGVVFICLLLTFGELLIAPVGLSLASKLAPAAFHTQTVALYYLSIALGTAAAGTLAQYYDVDNEVPYFATVGSFSVGVGVITALISPWIIRRMRGVR